MRFLFCAAARHVTRALCVLACCSLLACHYAAVAAAASHLHFPALQAIGTFLRDREWRSIDVELATKYVVASQVTAFPLVAGGSRLSCGPRPFVRLWTTRVRACMVVALFGRLR